MEERSFVQRGRQVQLQELTDVVAVRRDDVIDLALETNSVLESLARRVPEPQVQAFENGGWAFLKAAQTELPADVAEAQVFIKGGGRLVLGTNLLTVQFQDDVSEDEANTRLRPFGVRVVERMTFAPGLFQGALTDEAEGDAIDVANQLTDSTLVKFAEPVLIEQSGHR